MGESGGNGGKWGKMGKNRAEVGDASGGMKGSHAAHGSPFTVLPLFSYGPCAPIQRAAKGHPRPTEGLGIG